MPPAVLNLEQLAELLESNRAAASARAKEFAIGGQPPASTPQPATLPPLRAHPG